MTSREMLITFEELLRTTNPDLEFDVTINTDLAYTLLSRAQKEYVEINFLNGDTIQDNVNAIRKRSDVLRKLIKRTDTTGTHTLLSDGGYSAIFDASDYWMFMSGTMYHSSLTTNDKGSTNKIMELDLINHYDLQKKIRTINNEPVYKYIPIVLENIIKTGNDDIQITGLTINGTDVTVSGTADALIDITVTLTDGIDSDSDVVTSGNDGTFSVTFDVTEWTSTNYSSTATSTSGSGTSADGFVFYLDKEKYDTIGSTINAATFNIIYLAYPTGIDGSNDSELASSTHHDIVKLAVDIFLKEYKFLLGQINKKPNG